jgi:hypothetical protein
MHPCAVGDVVLNSLPQQVGGGDVEVICNEINGLCVSEWDAQAEVCSCVRPTRGGEVHGGVDERDAPLAILPLAVTGEGLALLIGGLASRRAGLRCLRQTLSGF